MDFGKNLNNLMEEAKKMQQQMLNAQTELTALVVTGSAGGNMVVIRMNGRHDVLDVQIRPSLLDDVEMLQGLVAAAVNDAVKRVEDASQKKIQELTKSLNLPTDLLKDKDGE